MRNVYKNIEENNPVKKRKVLIVFDDKIVHILTHKKTSTNSSLNIY